MTVQQTQQLLAVLFAAFPRAELPEVTIRLYTDHLQDLPHDLAQAAVSRAIDHCTYFPTIAELRAHAAAILVDDRAPLPGEAWAEVLAAAQDRSRFLRPPEFSHELVQRTVDALGWSRVCEFAAHPSGHDRHAFTSVYESLLQHTRATVQTSATTNRLTGAVDPLSLPGPANRHESVRRALSPAQEAS